MTNPPHAEETCGQELAASAVVPEQVGALFAHVAANLRRHADWVGRDSDAAAREHQAMLGVAVGYEEIAAAAQRTAELMRGLETLAPVPHDPSAMDRAIFLGWMKSKMRMQRALAALLLEHAEQSEKALEQFMAGRAE